MRKKLAIARPDVAERQRKPLLACTLFTAYATWQRECDEPNAVMHLVVGRLVGYSQLLERSMTRNRSGR